MFDLGGIVNKAEKRYIMSPALRLYIPQQKLVLEQYHDGIWQ